MEELEYLEFAGKTYVINLEAFDGLLVFDPTPKNDKVIETETTQMFDATMNPTSTSVVTREFQRGKEIDMSKYEMIRTMIDIILAYNEEIDDSLGIKRAFDGLPISFKIAFNTLIKYGILKEII